MFKILDILAKEKIRKGNYSEPPLFKDEIRMT